MIRSCGNAQARARRLCAQKAVANVSAHLHMRASSRAVPAAVTAGDATVGPAARRTMAIVPAGRALTAADVAGASITDAHVPTCTHTHRHAHTHAGAASRSPLMASGSSQTSAASQSTRHRPAAATGGAAAIGPSKTSSRAPTHAPTHSHTHARARLGFARPATDVTSTVDAFLSPRIKREFEMRVIHDAARLSLSYLRNVVSSNARAGFAKRIPQGAMPDLAPAVASIYGAAPTLPGTRKRKGGGAAAPLETGNDGAAWIRRSLGGRTAVHAEWLSTLMAMRVAYARAYPDRVVVPRRLASETDKFADSANDVLAAVQEAWRHRNAPTSAASAQTPASPALSALRRDAQPITYAIVHLMQASIHEAGDSAMQSPRAGLQTAESALASATPTVPEAWVSFVNKLLLADAPSDTARRALVATLVPDSHPAYPLVAPMLLAYLGDKEELSRCLTRVVKHSEGACVREAAFLLNELAVNTARRNAVKGEDGVGKSDVLERETGLTGEVVARLQRIFGAGAATAGMETTPASARRSKELRLARVPGVGEVASKSNALTPEQVVAMVRDAKKSKRFRGMYDTAVYAPDAWLDVLSRLGFTGSEISAAIPIELQNVARSAASAWSLPVPVSEYLALLRHSILLLRQRYVHKGRRLRALPAGASAVIPGAPGGLVPLAEATVESRVVAPSSSPSIVGPPSESAQAVADEPMNVQGLLYLSRVGMPKMTKAALVAGARKLLAFVAAHADADAKFAFRRVVADLEAYRAANSAGAARPPAAAVTGRAAAAATHGRLVEEAELGGSDFVYTDLFESDATRTLLRNAVNCLPPQQRQAVYPRMLRYLGVLRLRDVDERLFGAPLPRKVLGDKLASSDGQPTRGSNARIGIGGAVVVDAKQKVGSAAVSAVSGGQLSWSAVWNVLNKATTPPVPGATGAGDTQSAAATALSDLPSLDEVPSVLSEEGVAMLPSPMPSAATTPSQETGGQPAELSAAERTPAEGSHFVERRFVREVARKLSVMLNSRDLERLMRLLRNHAAVSRRLERKWHEVAEARLGRKLTPAQVTAHPLRFGERELTLADLVHERVLTTARAASGIFGPLAFMLDDAFLAALQTQQLTPAVLSSAKRMTLLEDAQMAIAEELVLDEETSAAGVDTPDDLLFHLQRVRSLSSDGSASGQATTIAETPGSSPAAAAGILASVHRSFQSVLLPMMLPRGDVAIQDAQVERVHDSTKLSEGHHAPIARMSAMQALANDFQVVREAAAAANAGEGADTASAAQRNGADSVFDLKGPWADKAGNAPFDSWGRVGISTSARLFDDPMTSDLGTMSPSAAATVAEFATTMVDDEEEASRLLMEHDNFIMSGAPTPAEAPQVAGTTTVDADWLGVNQGFDHALASSQPGDEDAALVSVADPGPALQRVHTYLSHTITVPVRMQARALRPDIDDDSSSEAAAPSTHSADGRAMEVSGPDAHPVMSMSYPGVSFVSYGINESGNAATTSGSDAPDDWMTWNSPDRLAHKIMVSRLPFNCRLEDVVTAFKHCGHVVRVELWRDRADAMHKKVTAQEVFLQQKSRWQVTDKLIKAQERAESREMPMADASPTEGTAPRFPHMAMTGVSELADPRHQHARAFSSLAAGGVAEALMRASFMPPLLAAFPAAAQWRRAMSTGAAGTQLSSDAAEAGGDRSVPLHGDAGASTSGFVGVDDGETDALSASDAYMQLLDGARADAARKSSAPLPQAPTPKSKDAGQTASKKRKSKADDASKTTSKKGQQHDAPSDGLDALRPKGPLATRRMYKAFEERRRKYNMVSPLHAFVYFSDRAGAEMATSDALRLFGVVIYNQACRTELATSCKTLYIGNAWRGMPPEAAMAALEAMLQHAGFSLRLLDEARLRQGMLSNGEVFVEFPSHAAAVKAAQALRGAQLQPGVPLIVGWATAEEWQQARPKMPVYF